MFPVGLFAHFFYALLYIFLVEYIFFYSELGKSTNQPARAGAAGIMPALPALNVGLQGEKRCPKGKESFTFPAPASRRRQRRQLAHGGIGLPCSPNCVAVHVRMGPDSQVGRTFYNDFDHFKRRC